MSGIGKEGLDYFASQLGNFLFNRVLGITIRFNPEAAALASDFFTALGYKVFAIASGSSSDDKAVGYFMQLMTQASYAADSVEEGSFVPLDLTRQLAMDIFDNTVSHDKNIELLKALTDREVVQVQRFLERHPLTPKGGTFFQLLCLYFAPVHIAHNTDLQSTMALNFGGWFNGILKSILPASLSSLVAHFGYSLTSIRSDAGAGSGSSDGVPSPSPATVFSAAIRDSSSVDTIEDAVEESKEDRENSTPQSKL